MAAPDPAPQLFEEFFLHRRGRPHMARMLARKPPMLVIVALANKIARIVWALITKGGVYRAPAVPA